MTYRFAVIQVAVAFAIGVSTAERAAKAEELWSLNQERSKPSDSSISMGSTRQNKAASNSGSSSVSNLPPEYLRHVSRQDDVTTAVVLPEAKLKSILKILKVGDEVDLSISHSLIAFADEKTPVVAVVPSGRLHGLKFIGHSVLEQNSKRIFIHFDTVLWRGRLFKTRVEALTKDGQPGFVGDYHSREGTYFAGDVISSLVAAYFDGLVPRTSNVFGQVESDNSLDSAFKKGLAGGAMSSAERFKEKLKKVPEFSEIEGPIHARALILENATET